MEPVIAQMIERHNNSIRTALECRYNDDLSGEPDRSPIFVLEWLISASGVTGGVTKWGYIFAELGLHFWGIGGGR